jgi:serine/threonine protein kinase
MTILMLCICLLSVMCCLLVLFCVKYRRIKQNVQKSIFHHLKTSNTEPQQESALTKLTEASLPSNFASRQQINALLEYVDGERSTHHLPDDFKELGRGQFGVVYQVRLPAVGLVAAKMLPETIRHGRRRSAASVPEDRTMLDAERTDAAKKKATDMLIDEIRVMHKAGKHVNIVALKKVAYPEMKLRFLFTGGPIRDEDSFYLMELCSNGSLESMLKRFLLLSSGNIPSGLPSLYELIGVQRDHEMSLGQACDRCYLSDDDLILIAYQVACGVDYLNRRQIAHCDIAPRNVLVNSRFMMKICDFG